MTVGFSRALCANCSRRLPRAAPRCPWCQWRLGYPLAADGGSNSTFLAALPSCSIEGLRRAASVVRARSRIELIFDGGDPRDVALIDPGRDVAEGRS